METRDQKIFYALLPITFISAGFLLYYAGDLILWIFCAFFLFALIDPFMQRLSRSNISPIVSAFVLVAVASAILFGMGVLVYRASVELVLQTISYKAAILQFYDKITTHLSGWVQNLTHLPSIGSDAPAPADMSTPGTSSIPEKIGSGVLSGINSILNAITFITLTPLLTFFMVAERKVFANVFGLFLQSQAKAKQVWSEITGMITAFFLGNLALILVTFPIFILIFKLVGVKSYVNLALLSSVFNLVPFLGFVLAAFLPTLDLLLNGGNLAETIILASSCLVTHFAISNIVTPKVLGSKLDLNATVSGIALVGWGHLWGPAGLLLGIPLTAMIKIAFQHSSLPIFIKVAALMSEDPNFLSKHFKNQKV